jgi:hypothetical protein
MFFPSLHFSVTSIFFTSILGTTFYICYVFFHSTRFKLNRNLFAICSILVRNWIGKYLLYVPLFTSLFTLVCHLTPICHVFWIGNYLLYVPLFTSFLTPLWHFTFDTRLPLYIRIQILAKKGLSRESNSRTLDSQFCYWSAMVHFTYSTFCSFSRENKRPLPKIKKTYIFVRLVSRSILTIEIQTQDENCGKTHV